MIDAANSTAAAGHIADLRTITSLRLDACEDDFVALLNAGAITAKEALGAAARLRDLQTLTQVQVVGA